MRTLLLLAIAVAILSDAAGTASGSTEAPPTAQAVVFKLKAAGLPIGTYKVYAGRRGQYAGRANFRDRRIEESPYAPGYSIAAGGSVEVFTSRAAAQRRFDATRSSPFGRNYLEGTVILRLTHYLSPPEVRRYEAVFRRLF